MLLAARVLVFFLLLCLVTSSSNFRCTNGGKCVNDDQYVYRDGDKGDLRCTADGQCESDASRIETRLSATGQELKDKALRVLFEIWAGNDFSRVDEFISKSHVLSSPMLERPLLGVAGLRSYVELTRASFSDYSYFIDDIVSEGNTVVVRYQFFGLHTGPYQGVGPTGKFVQVRDCIAFFTFWQNKIQQTLVVWPHHHVLQQLQEYEQRATGHDLIKAQV